MTTEAKQTLPADGGLDEPTKLVIGMLKADCNCDVDAEQQYDGTWSGSVYTCTSCKAADLITRLASERDRLRADLSGGAFVPISEWNITIEERDRLKGALEKLANAEALSEVPRIVAGWNGPPEKPYAPHPANLGASIKTTCGRVYKLEQALVEARALLLANTGEGTHG